MRTVGVLGAMSWESTVLFCQLLNQRIGERMGGGFVLPGFSWPVSKLSVLLSQLMKRGGMYVSSVGPLYLYVPTTMVLSRVLIIATTESAAR